MIRAAAALALLVGAASCNEGNDGLLSGSADAAGVDSSSTSDLAALPDMANVKTCGQIITCALGCGMITVQCLIGCGSGASTGEYISAAQLGACVAQNCLPRDGGMPSPTTIATCAFKSCPQEVAACSGLGF